MAAVPEARDPCPAKGSRGTRSQAHQEALRHRFEAAQTLEASRREIDAKRIELEAEMVEDLEYRQRSTAEANRLFSIYARRLYSDARTPYLAFTAGKQPMQIEAHIDTDDSRGIHNMVIFCFDLALAVIACREGRGSDFLVHDSHLYDGVDARQVAAALSLAIEVTEAEGMQYVVTMNSDDLAKAVTEGFNPDGHVIQPSPTSPTAACSASGSEPGHHLAAPHEAGRSSLSAQRMSNQHCSRPSPAGISPQMFALTTTTEPRCEEVASVGTGHLARRVGDTVAR